MNRVLAFVTATVFALPLFAATNPKPISTPDTAPATDSPLVAAAKKSGRLGKKPSNVITNDTLAKTGGHVTTTQEQKPITTPIYQAVPMQTQTQTPQAQAPAAVPATAAKDKKKETMKQVAAQYEGDSADMDHDPAQQEQQMKTMQQAPAPGDKKP